MTDHLNTQLQDVGLTPLKEVDQCPERTQYLEHFTDADWGDKDWQKELKRLKEQYFINFYKRLAELHPYLKYERGRVDSFWDYNEEEGVYEPLNHVTLAGRVIRALRQDEMEQYCTDASVKRIILNFTADGDRAVTLDDFSPESGWLHVENGWLNLTTKELEPHTPERLSLYKLAVSYDPDATCPLYDKFLDEDVEMPKDQVRVLDQFSGYILTERIDQQTALIFEGAPGCGKSLLVELWMAILGAKSTNKSLNTLNNGSERFIGMTLAHKNLVWFDETNPKTANINEFLQTLITGAYIDIERKGVSGHEQVTNTLKVILSLNEMPDHMPTGMDRRYRHILFTRSFTNEGNADTTLKQKIVQDELSGILNRMLRGLDDLNKMGKFTLIAGEDSRKREYSLAADDISAFLSEHFEPESLKTSVIRYTYKEIRDAFVAEFPKSYHKQLSTRGFNKKLLANRLPEFKHITTASNGRERGYKGLRLKEGYELPNNSYDPIKTTDEIASENAF